MFDQRKAVFLMNLVQDVNVLRPLIFMAARDFGFRPIIFVSPKFGGRDIFGIWQAELELLREHVGAEIHYYKRDWEVFRQLTGTGVIFAGSESGLREHQPTHSVFRYAPPGFLKVTLQHGFECVGFRHSAAHDPVYGREVSSGADFLCSWQDPNLQPSIPASQRSKVLQVGPTCVLQSFSGSFERDPRAPGLVCENLHSVRLNATKQTKRQFVTAFTAFCEIMQNEGREVVLRPHPGGQYMMKNKVPLPANAAVNNAPMYRVDLRRFPYGISAPSSVLLDMLLADIPVAVWNDPQGNIDASNYSGIAQVSDPRDWADFAREASVRPQPFIDAQRAFLAREGIPTDPRDVFARYARIFRAAERVRMANGVRPVERRRILAIANAHLPTLQACIERPLAALTSSGELSLELLTEERLRERLRTLGSDAAVVQWTERKLETFRPDTIIFSRYSGPHSDVVVSWAKRNSVPVIYQIDDDLLSVPRSLGDAKHAYHNAPERLSTVRRLLAESDLVYVSTDRLRRRLLDHVPGIRAVAGAINCSGTIIGEPKERPARTIGYAASTDHAPNLEMVLPAIVDLLDRHAHLSFELFGSIAVPPELVRFGDRIRSVPPIPNYEQFLGKLGERSWDIGICPLVDTDFNRSKSNNKWVEYTALGIATIASGNTVYDECCAGGCGWLAEDIDGWRDGLERLVVDTSFRVETVRLAQQKLAADYGIEQHRSQVLGIIERARECAQASLVRATALADGGA